MTDVFAIILRTLCVYLFILGGIRLFGKNQLSQLNAADVVLLILIANSVQNAMVGSNTSLQGGLTAALVLFVTNLIIKKFISKNRKIKKFLESEPVTLIKDGQINHKNLMKEHISLSELYEAIREHGVEDATDVKLAMFEIDGSISIISFDKETEKTHLTRHKKISRNFPDQK
ncbi:DUF421 domain-containing protein [Ornithobacterium rhinotracheale]|uniref:DUF421 domain-containing protein n=1 Tax=Ornithobacterium rhinotracheale TaxID=28251 RepID=UPI00129CE7BD|nr:YetF domain-containing protein [Ornithobacterium rhinotracheale]MRI63963.1 DUF421 domain-containing protein [Ornithobacterium rhinotracheale]MRJ10704.1 DUF421 domain-containing protein [Ornithobacterium rhinotracheale]